MLAIGQSLAATQEEQRQAYYRAMVRTRGTVNKLVTQYLKPVLSPRKLSLLRKRIKSYLKRPKGYELGEIKFWFGLNDMPISKVKGRVKRQGSRKRPQGAIFTPSSRHLSTVNEPTGFIASIGGGRSIFRRKGTARFPLIESTIEISEAMNEAIEDQIFDQIPAIFMHHYEVDLKGRIASRG
ncbi:hypothetical protein [Photobacterium leiognathi]|uniref:hypothetical protein n=1 Tax=Photobacterium leiognathi TaxID=553611 RepID=UPI0027386A86|nr:hypothetical protein [Photobacterium leiognathi]